MKPEIEVKFIKVDHDDMRKRLQDAGATLFQPMRLMRRVVFDWPGHQLRKSVDGYLRVRDEGHRTTITYKQFDAALSVDGVREVETTVGDYETAIALVVAIGMMPRSHQHTRRETWQLGDVEVVLDEWPWISPSMEIEGPSQLAVEKAAKKLGLCWEDAVIGSVTQVYRSEYDIPRNQDIGQEPDIRFELPVPKWLDALKRKDV